MKRSLPLTRDNLVQRRTPSMTSDADFDVKVERVFWLADKDRSGTISQEELFITLSQNGYKLTWEQFQENFSSFDTDGDQQISFDEFLRGMGRPSREWKRFELYRKMFERYDKSGDGYVTKDEIASVFREQKISVTSRQLNLVFQIMDLDNSGQIEYDEFLHFFFGYKAPK